MSNNNETMQLLMGMCDALGLKVERVEDWKEETHIVEGVGFREMEKNMDAINSHVGRNFKRSYLFVVGEKTEVITRNPKPEITYRVTQR